MSGMKRKVLIDCDPGNDDVLAIFMALSAPDVDVIAITCVEGNTNVKQTGLNTLRALNVANRLDIPVFLGCSSSLLGRYRTDDPSSSYHGNDGLGDVPDPASPTEESLQAEHAVQALIRLSKQYAGQLHVIALGPLTNVAMATRLDPGLGKRLASCNIMGGTYLGRGNVTPNAEFNFHCDPEAAFIVLNTLGCPMVIVPWETCTQHRITWEKYFASRDFGTPKSDFMKCIDKKTVACAQSQSQPNHEIADETVVACLINSDVISKSFHAFATVELVGEHTIGQMIVDLKGQLKKDANITIVTELDQELFESMMIQALL